MSAVLDDILERLGEVERRLQNVVRHTRIAALDEDAARVRVILEEADDGEPVLSAWLPWYTHRAGPDIDWHAPEVGEQVTLLSPGGQTELGCVLHSLYQDAFPAPEASRDIRTIRFKDGSEIRYHRDAHLLECNWVGDVTQTVGGDVSQSVAGNMAVDVAGSCVLTCPDNTIDGPLHVTGRIDCDDVIESLVNVIGANVSLPFHITTGVTPGSGLSGLPQ